MPCSWGFAALLACLCLRTSWVGASPSLDFPVNAQVPPVARALCPYIFVFSATTFSSANAPISYTISGQPTWLQLIGGTRTFTGLPESQDVGATTFNLVASDNSGSTSASVTLVVLAWSGPEIGQPVLQQLAKAGPISAPASLLLQPLQAFAFTFEAGTFVNTSTNTEFYAVSADNTPLPNWVQFDASSLGFSGTSPPLVSSTATPQIYGIKLVASDVVGFSEATVDFELVVSYHVLTSTKVHQTINISPGETFSSTKFRNTLTLDSQSVENSDIVSVTSNGPEWVHLDANTISINGIPPSDTTTTNVTITILDQYGNILDILVQLDAASNSASLFTGTLPDVNVTAGKLFSYTINTSLLGSPRVQLSADLGIASTWLLFSPQNRTFHGNVPSTLQAELVTITLTAIEGPSSDSESFVIHIASTLHISSSAVTQSTSSTKASIPSGTIATISATSQPSLGNPFMSRSKVIEIALATILPTFFVALIICLILFCRRERARRGQKRHSTSQEAIMISEVRSIPKSEVMEVPAVPETSESSFRRSIPSRPPQIELPWAPDSVRTSKNRMSKRLQAAPAASVDSTWGDFIVALPESALTKLSETIRAVDPKESISHDDVLSLTEVTPNYSRNRSTRSIQPLRQISTAKRSSQRYSSVSLMSPGLPQRLSGAGHGAGGEAPQCILSEARSSWQTTMGTIPGVESKRSTVMLNDFPSPPRETSGRDMSTVLQAWSPNRPPQATWRIARNNSTRSSGLQKWYTDRARDKLEGSARFSSVWSRPSSSSRVLYGDGLGSRAISAALMTDGESSNHDMQHSLSGFARRRRTNSIQRSGAPSYPRTPSKLRRDVSTVRSGQFDSAMSSDSWEDENIFEEENEDGARRWWRMVAGDMPSTRLPFEAVPHSPQGGAFPVAPPRQARLANNKNPVEVAGRQAKSSEKSEQGSLAFV